MRVVCFRPYSRSPFIFIFRDTTDLYYAWNSNKGKCCQAIIYVLQRKHLENIWKAYLQDEPRRRKSAV